MALSTHHKVLAAHQYTINGIKIGTADTGVHYSNRNDLVVFSLAEGTVTAATFTRNLFAAAPVIVAGKHLQAGSPTYLIINAGNANAGTGRQGLEDALRYCRHLAEIQQVSAESILPFSTGVIGEYLPMDKIRAGIDRALQNLNSENWQAAAQAIMTTDTVAKIVVENFSINGRDCRITGIGKGAGMIHPNMATMLAFLATDATITQSLLQRALQAAVDDSFNCITIDGDTSTNDACVVCATGKGRLSVSENDTIYDVFTAKLALVCGRLAELIVRDGEGASKLARVRVVGGRNRDECKAIGYAVALSPLVKTALFGQDPNWGRILAAVGRAPIEPFDSAKVNILLDDVCIIRGGEKDKWYTEEDGKQVMRRDEITITIDMNQGHSEIEILTSDLSHGYVNINANYRS